jgi:hypothetical protein
MTPISGKAGVGKGLIEANDRQFMEPIVFGDNKTTEKTTESAVTMVHDETHVARI